MALKENLLNKLKSFFTEPFEVEETSIVPDTDYNKLTFGNKGLIAELCFLFVDIRNSSKLIEIYGAETAARIYEGFHEIGVRIIEANQGKIRAIDGDRIMGVFPGEQKRNNAVKAGFNIGWAITKDLNCFLKTPLNYGIGIESGKILVIKIGKGNDANTQDIVWVGNACNYAAYYCDRAFDCIITSSGVYDKLWDENKFYPNKEKPIIKWSAVNLPLKKSFSSVVVYQISRIDPY